MKLPPEFTERMSAMLAEEYPKFLASYDDAPLAGLRANTLKISPATLKKLLPGLLEPVAWCDDGFYLEPGQRPGKSPYYHAGLYYIQEPSAMCPAQAMDVAPGQRVLDLCAAPGGKSTQLAAKLKGNGILVANDMSASRARALLKNIEVSGITNAVVANEPPARLAGRFEEYFDRILVDAPCSGEGMFRKDSDARRTWTAHKPEDCRLLQREILHYAAMMLKPGGRLMYSTCTFAPEENEIMIAEFLSEHKEFSGVTLKGLEPGIYGEPHTARLWPHKHKGEGHFFAYLEKSEGVYEAQQEYVKDEKLPLALYHEFCRRYLNITPCGSLRIFGHSLFLYPKGLPDLKGMRLMRVGLYLGDILTKRFEPGQAFAMTLTPGDVKLNIDFKASDERVIRYLKGESFEVSADGGWNLITLEGWPLGWAKVMDGRIKNKYLKGWLMN